jgi:hypothetical protein
MAIDTRNKRASAMNLMCPWRGAMPAPDSTIDDADRAMSLFLYAGIVATSAISGFGRIEYTMPRSQLGYTLERSQLDYTMANQRLEYTGEVP